VPAPLARIATEAALQSPAEDARMDLNHDGRVTRSEERNYQQFALAHEAGGAPAPAPAPAPLPRRASRAAAAAAPAPAEAEAAPPPARRQSRRGGGAAAAPAAAVGAGDAAAPPTAAASLFEVGTVRASDDGSRWRVEQAAGGRAHWERAEAATEAATPAGAPLRAGELRRTRSSAPADEAAPKRQRRGGS